jgi:hypothetical protein
MLYVSSGHSSLQTVVHVIAKSVPGEKAILKRSIWPDKWQIALPKNGSQ